LRQANNFDRRSPVAKTNTAADLIGLPETLMNRPMQSVNANWPVWRFLPALSTALLMILITGCHDGPMYGMKAANPFYSIKQWKADEAYGPTDHVRRQELTKLADMMDTLPPERQGYWFSHLRGVMENDESPEMRRLAVLAAGKSTLPQSAELISSGLKDESLKVRLTACEMLGNRPQDSESTRLLAETAGSTSDLDVRNAAFAALGKHQNKVAVDALRLALDTRDPATRSLAVASLRGSTGKNYGDDPQSWIAALDGQDVPEQQVELAERVKNLIR